MFNLANPVITCIPNRYVVFFNPKDLVELIKLKKATYLLYVVEAKHD